MMGYRWEYEGVVRGMALGIMLQAYESYDGYHDQVTAEYWEALSMSLLLFIS